ncbi:cytochrome P450 [Kibdelosporangium phytohabitans]|uniref:Cytochrome n=1 Tax=Kibdelosporangium phytohabitans TaxID=860235 RepID=A0A0N7F2S3_9PSEU|nr:cytochrome P450 [Kibdelosporangium phytohabitans]ALG06631.1 cytochrome [Kibdelosporangium phytohabitans]MBE1467838.1 pentalenic acid synthase [Kibdelosporangium phytohabitans]
MITYPQQRTCPYHPSPGYGELRDGTPLRKVQLVNGQEAWVVSGHEQARALLADPRVSADRTNTGFPMIVPAGVAAIQTAPNRPFLVRDDPEHNRFRRMLISEFTVRRLRQLRPEIDRIVHDRIDAMLAAGPPADLVTAFSLPVPSLVICRMLGVPYADHEFFEKATSGILRGRTPQESTKAGADLLEYLTALAADPPPGLIARLKRERVGTGQMSLDELAFTALLLLGAGHETTASMITLSVIALLEHPEQLAAFRTGHDAVPASVEELLRYLTIVESILRVAVGDIEIAGEVIKAGEGIVIATGVVNRAEDAFDEPDRFDLGRSAVHHVAFGYGVHQCLGQNLARTELQVALPALFDRVPGLRLAAPVGELELRPIMTIQGVNALPVTW